MGPGRSKVDGDGLKGEGEERAGRSERRRAPGSQSSQTFLTISRGEKRRRRGEGKAKEERS